MATDRQNSKSRCRLDYYPRRLGDNDVEIDIDDKGKVVISPWNGENKNWQCLFNKDGTVTNKFSDELEKRLGKRAEQIIEENNAKNKYGNQKDQEIVDSSNSTPEEIEAAEERTGVRNENIQKRGRETNPSRSACLCETA